MAKPGSGRARQIANGSGAVNLDQVAMSDEQAWEVQEVLELKNGMRCSGCGRRITLGMQFTSVDVRAPGREIVKLSACMREDCDFAEQCRDGATWMQAVEFAWLDDAGADAPPAKIIAQRNARLAQQQQQEDPDG